MVPRKTWASETFGPSRNPGSVFDKSEVSLSLLGGG